MADNAHLKKVATALPNYFCYFKDDNILVVSEDKTLLPFAYLIFESDLDAILLSIAVDYANGTNVANVALIANDYLPVLLSDVFYISITDGRTYFDDEAHSKWQLESLDIEQFEPYSTELH